MSQRARKALAALCASLALALCAALAGTYRMAAPFATQMAIRQQPVRRAARVPSPWPSGTVDVNTAEEAALMALPGVGVKLAQAIIAERTANGAYRYPEDLLAVKGIGAKKLAALQSLLAFETHPE